MTIQNLDDKIKEVNNLIVDLDIRGIQNLSSYIGNRRASALSDADWNEASKQLFLGVNQGYREAGEIPDEVGNWIGQSALNHLVRYTSQDIQKLAGKLKTEGTAGIVKIVKPIIEDTVKFTMDGIPQSINPSEIQGYASEFSNFFGRRNVDPAKVQTINDVMDLYGAYTFKKGSDNTWQEIVRKYR